MKKLQCLIGILSLCACTNYQHNENNDHIPQLSIDSVRTIFKIDYINDHSIIYNERQNKWHLFGIIKPQNRFIHLTAKSLTQNSWEREDKDFTDNNKEIWAPHIIKHKDLYYMFYTRIGTPREICCATSKDLYHWDYMEKPILAQANELNSNIKNKDPMVFFDKDKKQWIMYYSMMKDQKNWVVGYSTSKDLKNWSDYKICFDENTSNPSVESPFVMEYNNKYLLFLSARPWPIGGEDVFISETPYHWENARLIKRFNPWHAAEIIKDVNGDLYMTLSSGPQSNDLKITRLTIE